MCFLLFTSVGPITLIDRNAFDHQIQKEFVFVSFKYVFFLLFITVAVGSMILIDQNAFDHQI